MNKLMFFSGFYATLIALGDAGAPILQSEFFRLLAINGSYYNQYHRVREMLIREGILEFSSKEAKVYVTLSERGKKLYVHAKEIVSELSKEKR